MHPSLAPHKEPPKELPGVRHIILVGAGKGGVGKSTVSLNVAVALAKAGSRVGLMDADFYGPNIPRMLGVNERPAMAGDRMIPPERHGIKVMSLGFFVPADDPIIWRGPMLHSAVKQFAEDVEWGELDYLIVDLPPGTGDVQLSLAQTALVSGAVVVATPQKVALDDARKAVGLFQKIEVPVLGLVENMSYMLCPHCQGKVDPFGEGGALRAAKEWGVNFLGALPFDPSVREGGDEGRPAALDGSEIAEAFGRVAAAIAKAANSQTKKIKLENLIVS